MKPTDKVLGGSKSLISDRTIIEPALNLQPVYFDVFWGAMQTAAGSIESFLEQYLEISRSALQTLREKFTE